MKVHNSGVYIERKMTSYLERWKGRPDRLPLILKGARQVGKTLCVRRFAAGNYESFIEINFALNPEYKVIVRDGFSVATIIKNISLVDPRWKFLPGRTLIFFDEVQDFPEIATSFKSFAEDGRYDVISSGSLLGIQLKRISSISVGYQETVEMKSVDFEEFLHANHYSRDQIEGVYAHLVDRTSIESAACETFGRLFLEFCSLGGMPEVVSRYLTQGDFSDIPFIQTRIVNDYRSDIRKYAEGLDPQRIVSVFDSIPSQLAKENKKFQLSKIAHGARYKDYWGCVEWLVDAGVVTVCRALDFPELPLAAHEDPSKYKLYMSDSGLLLSMIDEESQADVRVRRNLGTWKGGLFENIIAEALVKNGVAPVYFKKENATLEMDFFMRSGDDLVPIEVKAENSKAKSLRTLIDSEHYHDIRWGVKLINGNVGYSNGILSVPQWCAFLLPRLMKERRG